MMSAITQRAIAAFTFLAASSSMLVLTGIGSAQDKPVTEVTTLTAAQSAFFESKIRPVLVKNCYACHSAQSKEVQGELRVDSAVGLRRGGISGAAIVVGKPAESLLIQAIRHADPDIAMPPKDSGPKLSDEVIRDFERWIADGAPDPRTVEVAAGPAVTYDTSAARAWWAFQPLQRPTVPREPADGWARTDIDRFVQAAWAAKAIRPVADADKLSLIRRVYFDLVGLPPTPSEVDAFVRDASPTAFTKVVDGLLARPQFGERWGQRWLDVARYAESTGRDLNVAFPHAWRYRDYVVAAFNKDKPYDQFIREQLAGDLFPVADASTNAERLIATGFLAVGPKGLGELTPRQYALDLADEQLDTTSQAFIGLTISCARCHDHKFDPISQREYTALSGIFLSTRTQYGTLAGPKNNQETSLIELPNGAKLPSLLKPLTPAERDRLQRELADATERYESLMRERAAERRSRSADRGNAAREFIRIQVALGKKAQLEAQLDAYDDAGRPKAFCMGVSDRPRANGPIAPLGPAEIVEIKGSSGRRPASGFENIADSPLFARGEMSDPRDRVPRGFPSLLTWPGAPTVPADQSGRRQLADWIASPKNPLTARVMANRIWSWLFGQGIVTTVDNFGTMGSEPSNQALLDFLANRLIENKWSVKKTVREVVLSRTYQLAAVHDATAYAADPQNLLFWRHDSRRLDAECIRDAMLAASGQLSQKPPIGSPVALAGDGVIGSTGAFVTIKEETFANASNLNRSLYLPIARDLLPDAMAVFDHPDANRVTGQRETTSVPAQALYLLNNPFVLGQATKLAERVTSALPATQVNARVDLAFKLTLGRPANANELNAAKMFFDRSSDRPAAEAWTEFCLALFNTAEFRHTK